jgi:DNA-binding NarL/FixJ family response regulator
MDAGVLTRSPVALVVDDHDAVRRALCDRIKASFGQCRLREAGTVDEALKIVETERVDIVLMDIQLPGMDGVDGTRVVLERSPHTSVVVVSIFDDSSHRSAASKAGAIAYVCKRAINRELIPVLENLMNCAEGHA